MANEEESALLSIADMVKASIKKKTLHADYPSILDKCRSLSISSYSLHLIIEKELNRQPEPSGSIDTAQTIGYCNIPPKEKKEPVTIQPQPINDTTSKPLSRFEIWGWIVTIIAIILSCVCISMNVSKNDWKNKYLDLLQNQSRSTQSTSAPTADATDSLQSAESQLRTLKTKLNNTKIELHITKHELYDAKAHTTKLHDALDILMNKKSVIATNIDLKPTYYINYSTIRINATFICTRNISDRTLYIKMYQNEKMLTYLSSPDGYTSSSKISLKEYEPKEIETVELGDLTDGKWRIEFWMNGGCIGSKEIIRYTNTNSRPRQYSY